MKRIPLIAVVLAFPLLSRAAPVTFNYTGGEQQFTIPTSGAWQIVAYGAEGGSPSVGTFVGGLGADIGGEFTLASGELLDLYVGGHGSTDIPGTAGGGGGTFIVVDASGTPLVVAAGGGGANDLGAGGNALTTHSGSSGGPAGGSIGAGGGGGFTSDGGSSAIADVGQGGKGFPNGLAGGAIGGGYGGGGRGNGEPGGGGGGYNGGAGGLSGDPGSGGGSYLDSSALNDILMITNTGNGFVAFTYQGPAPVPEPAPFTVAVLGILGIGVIRRRRRMLFADACVDTPFGKSFPVDLKIPSVISWRVTARVPMRTLIVLFVSGTAFFAPVAGAATMYTIDFSGGSPNPTSGSFTYDPSTGFSNFIVVWEGVSVDLTANANAPYVANATGCSGEASTPAYGFAIMSQALTGCPTTPVYVWQGMLTPATGGFSTGSFGFIALSGSPVQKGDFVDQGGFIDTNGPEFGANAQGSWTITADTSTTPEPADGWLSCLGMALMGIVAARQRRRASRSNTNQ